MSRRFKKSMFIEDLGGGRGALKHLKRSNFSKILIIKTSKQFFMGNQHVLETTNLIIEA